MLLSRKLSLLSGLYDLLDEQLAPLQTVCEIGCAACCTCNVTATTLEAWPIYTELQTNKDTGIWQSLVHQHTQARYQPAATINGWARQCIQGGEACEAAPDPDWGACPLLTDAACPLYRHRPLGCRVMLSKQRCAAGGVAEMDPFGVTLSNLFAQVIEQVDSGGLSGNLTDLMLYLDEPEHRRAFEAGHGLYASGGLLANQPIPALMIPPEHRQQVKPVVDAIERLMAGVQV